MAVGNSTRSVSKIAAIATAAALVFLLAILGSWATQSYFSTVSRAEERVSASAKIVASHVSWIHQIATQTLRRIDDSLRSADLSFDGGVRDLKQATEALPDGVLAYVVDQAGRTLYSTDPDLKPVDITDRDYFTAVRDGQLEYTSSLLISRTNGSQIFVYSRRVIRAGAFAGAIMVAIPVEVLQPIWETVDLGGNYTISMIRDDGMLVARYPLAKTTLDMSGYLLFTDYLKNAPSGTYQADASPVDGVSRLVAYRTVEGTPFIAVAAADYTFLMHSFWQTLLMLSLVALVIVGGAGTAGWWIAHLLRAQEKQSQQLADALEANELLLREIHHRVKNNLQSVVSLVRLQMRGSEGFDALNSRIKSMIAVHEQIYKHDAYAAIDASELVRAVVSEALAAHDAQFEVRYDLCPQLVSAEKATAFALIVNEVVTNAVKYAYPSNRAGDLDIGLSAPLADGKTTLTISDRGAGFDPTTVKTGTGTRLIDGAVRQLAGKFSFEAQGGTHFTATLKLA
ncbi:sensor histidine kinase [Allorhizobium sp. NPDC080224]|uniref:sensor histidine kinase n=1 Tax=Allorhizobium sp. NPDC080224 TaxID=3390547 RepID=UPI003D0055CC